MPAQGESPGESFAAVLDGKEASQRERVVVYDEYGPVRMIRTKEWKYIHRYPCGPHELYDLVHDPGEKENVVNEPNNQEIIISMKANLQEWFYHFVDPQVDGIYEPVKGYGQIGMAGLHGKGVPAFRTKA